MAPRNVILMVADDLGRQLGCYGDEVIRTPNLDRLAKEGIQFENAFASTASCSASRSTLYTGLHTHQNGQYGLHNGRHHFTTFDNVESAPALLNSCGYLTGIVGKVHVGPDHVYPWTVKNELETRDVTRIAKHCATFLDRATVENKPFFLAVAYTDPHRDLTRGGFGNQDPIDDSVPIRTYGPSAVPIPSFANDTHGTRLELSEYYQSISRLDYGVGMVLKELKDRNLDETTLVIFLSDNGPPFINSKTTLYDAGIKLPFLIRIPGIDVIGTKNPNLVSFVDVLPTILDWAGYSETSSMTARTGPSRLGRSMLSILPAVTDVSGWDHVYGSHTFHEITNYWPTRFLRTSKYKYHRNLAWRLDFPLAADIYGSLSWEDVRNEGNGRSIGGRKLRDFFFRLPEELYDLERDPNELENLAGNAESNAVLKELRDRLETWQVRSEDPWLYRDGVSVHLIKHHLKAGLVIPNRFDFDPEAPGTDATSGPELVDWQKH